MGGLLLAVVLIIRLVDANGHVRAVTVGYNLTQQECERLEKENNGKDGPEPGWHFIATCQEKETSAGDDET